MDSEQCACYLHGELAGVRSIGAWNDGDPMVRLLDGKRRWRYWQASIGWIRRYQIALDTSDGKRGAKACVLIIETFQQFVGVIIVLRRKAEVVLVDRRIACSRPTTFTSARIVMIK